MLRRVISGLKAMKLPQGNRSLPEGMSGSSGSSDSGWVHDKTRDVFQWVDSSIFDRSLKDLFIIIGPALILSSCAYHYVSATRKYNEDMEALLLVEGNQREYCLQKIEEYKKKMELGTLASKIDMVSHFDTRRRALDQIACDRDAAGDGAEY